MDIDKGDNFRQRFPSGNGSFEELAIGDQEDEQLEMRAPSDSEKAASFRIDDGIQSSSFEIAEKNEESPSPPEWKWDRATLKMFFMFFVIACSMGITIGQINWAFGVMIDYFSEEHPEWSRTQINLAYSIHQITASLMAPFGGKAVDRFGPRIVVPVALLWTGSCFGLLVFVENLATLYVLYCLMGLGYIAIVFLGPPKVIGRWTDPKKRGRVMGLVSVGNNAGGLVMTQVSTAFASLRNCAIGFFLIDVALALSYFAFVRDRPPGQEDHEQQKQQGASKSKTTYFLQHLVKSRLFWVSTAAMVCIYWTYASVLSNILPALQAEGFEKQTAANLVSLVAIFGIFSKIIGGFLSDMFTARRVLMLVLVIQAIAVILFGLVEVEQRAWFWTLFSIYGISFGAVGALLPVLCMSLFGVENFGTIYGVQNLFFVIPSLLGPLLAGISYDNTGSYRYAFLGAGGVFLLGFCLLFILPKLEKQ